MVICRPTQEISTDWEHHDIRRSPKQSRSGKGAAGKNEDAVGNGELKLERSIEEVLDVALDETSELALRHWTRGEMRREAERN